MLRRLGLAAAVALLVGLAAACGGGEQDAAEPPWRLDTIVQPRDASSIGAVVAALPERIAGRARAAGNSPTSAVYTAPGEPDAFVGAVPRANVEGWAPGMTAAAFIDRLAHGLETDGFEGAKVDVEARALDPADQVVYLVWHSILDGRPWYAAAWASPEGEWLFNVSAGDVESRAALVEAFVDANPAAAAGTTSS